MSLILSLSAEIVCLVAAIAASYVLLLVYRNPLRPKWLDSELAASTLTIVAISVLILVVAWFVSGLSAAGLDPLAALALTATLFGLVCWGLWLIMGMGWRLKATAEGRSPFAGRGPLKGGGLAGQA